METSKKVSIFWCGKVMIGGAEGIRTLDPLNAIEVLSQLSYSPVDVQYTRGLMTAQPRNMHAAVYIMAFTSPGWPLYMPPRRASVRRRYSGS
jgi:hypothetical protein